MVGDGQQHESKAVVWWSTKKGGPKTKNISWPTRKLAGRKESDLQGEELVSHPCTTFQTRKTRTLSDPETWRATEGSKNQKLVSKREKWSTTTKRWSTDNSLPPGKRKQGSVHKPSQNTKSSETRRQGSHPKTSETRTSTTCTITERSIDDMADDISYGRDSPRVEDEPDIIPLPPRMWPFDLEGYHLQEHILPPSTFHHFTDFARRAPVDLLLQEPESHLSHHAREVSSRFTWGYGSIIAREWYMELPDVVRHIVDEAEFRPYCMGLSRHPARRTLLGALVERWWDTTNSFHFSATGDMTMTPYDFSMLTGLDVADRPAAWTYLLGAHPLIDRSSGRVRYTWFTEQYRRTTPETFEAIQEYARGFLMFLLETTLFSDKGNTVGLYLFSALHSAFCILCTFCIRILHSAFCILYTFCIRILHSTFCILCTFCIHILHSAFCILCTFCILTATVSPFTVVGLCLLTDARSRAEGRGTTSSGDVAISSAILRHRAGDGDHLSALAADARLISVPADDLMQGADAVLFLEEGEYTTYRHIYLMPPLTGVRTPTRRAADVLSSSHARAVDIPSTSRARTSRDRARGMPSTCQYAGWPVLPTELTGWQYGTSYPIPLEPSLPEHR
ncbi:hypothetical protein CsSME_00050969 [Camellia sinensis var. sinensis]